MQAAILHLRAHLRWYILAALAVISILLWTVVFHEDRRGILTFSVLNIGQGDALWIESPTGTQVIVDGGPDDTLRKELAAVNPWYDKHLDMLIVTNPDKDHYEGFLSVLKNYSVDAIMEPGTHSPTPTYAELEKVIADRHVPKLLGRRGERIDIGGGAYIEILFPDRDVSGLSTNDGSLVMRLVYGDTSVALQGDSPANVEQYLLGLDGSRLHSTILKAGHHGSKTSSSESYVREVSPQWAVMSSGIDNHYGHPNKETLATLDKLHIPALDTCVMGRIMFHSDGIKFTLENKNTAPVSAGCKSK
jgi:competence protein ComEC